MSLATPVKISNFQRKLYSKAKAEPAFRFYMLYDKVCRDDILSHAYALCRSNGGASGVDGVTFGMIEASGLETWLAALREDLVLKTYRPEPVRRQIDQIAHHEDRAGDLWGLFAAGENRELCGRLGGRPRAVGAEAES